MPSPVTHISGVIHAILTPALLGTSAVLMDHWDAGRALELLQSERVTYMAGAPTFLQEMVEHPSLGRFDTRSLRLFSCGGADVAESLIRTARIRLPGCVAKRVYGSTEFPTITTTDAADALEHGARTEGKAITPNEVRVVGADGRPLSPGIEGEVQARGPECFVGYTDPALNDESFSADGWFRTGDLGVLDAGGYLRITGRLKEIIVRKGEKISVREVEELIAAHPAVAEVAVIAVPDARTGERACAVVRLSHGASLSLEELCAFLATKGAARQKHPERLEIRAELPRTESGKVNRARLKRDIGPNI
jgi:cyclohexanecarboxylate-CoA ligase